MVRLKKNAEDVVSKSFVLHGVRGGPIAHLSSLPNLPSTDPSSALHNAVDSHRQVEHKHRRLRKASAQRPRSSIPVPVHSHQNEPASKRDTSPSWSKDDELCFTTNRDRSQAASSDQTHKAPFAKQTYKAYKPKSSPLENSSSLASRHARTRIGVFDTKYARAQRGFSTLADSYQHLLCPQTGFLDTEKAFPSVLKAGTGEYQHSRVKGEDEYVGPVLHGSAGLSQSFQGRRQNRESRQRDTVSQPAE